eukprot:1440297-Prymnesium_polylepis.2
MARRRKHYFGHALVESRVIYAQCVPRGARALHRVALTSTVRAVCALRCTQGGLLFSDEELELAEQAQARMELMYSIDSWSAQARGRGGAAVERAAVERAAVERAAVERVAVERAAVERAAAVERERQRCSEGRQRYIVRAAAER